MSFASATPCSYGKDRVGSAVDHQGRHVEAREPAAPRRSLRDRDLMVRARLEVRVALDLAGEDVTHQGFVVGVRRPVQHSEERDTRVDHRLLVVRIDAGLCESRCEQLGLGTGEGARRVSARENPDDRAGIGRRHDRRDRAHAVSVAQRDLLRDHPAHRRAHDVRRVDAVRVEHRDRVVGHVFDRVVGLAERVVRRQAGVTVVVADDEATGGREPFAELVGPHQHRRAGPHDEQDRGVGLVAERLGADVDVAGLDHSLGHRRSVGRTVDPCSRAPACRSTRSAAGG